jgi:hypothetical protein
VNNGPFVMIALLTVIILGMVGGAFLMVRPAAGPGAGTAAGRPGVSFQVTFVRSPQGIVATVTATNRGTEDLKDLRITRAALPSMTAGSSMPIPIARLPRGAATTITIPFTGTASSANAPLSLDLSYDYRFGLFGRGSGSSGIASTVP